MENPAQRAYLDVPEHRSGVLVVKLDPLSPAAAVLKESDVVMEVGRWWVGRLMICRE